MANYKARTKQHVVKQVDEIVNNSNSAQADDELFLPTIAGKTYAFRVTLWITSGTTPDFKYQITLNGNTGFKILGNVHSTTLAPTQDQNSAQEVLCDGNLICVTSVGRTISAGGDISLFWAQSSQDASNTTLHKGSMLEIWVS